MIVMTNFFSDQIITRTFSIDGQNVSSMVRPEFTAAFIDASPDLSQGRRLGDQPERPQSRGEKARVKINKLYCYGYFDENWCEISEAKCTGWAMSTGH